MTGPEGHDRLQRLIDADLPREALLLLLRLLRQQLAAADNDFAWSGWADATAALAEIDRLIAPLQRAELPERAALTRLVAPTGPLQEVAISSGWGREAGLLADTADRLIPQLWPPA